MEDTISMIILLILIVFSTATFSYAFKKYGLQHDLKLARLGLTAYLKTHIQIVQGKTIVDVFEDTANEMPLQIALISAETNTSFTYFELEQRANQVANWATDQGLKFGDVVALMMENRPEFITIWVGLAKIGVAIAMINTKLKQTSLIYNLKLSDAKVIIFGSELFEQISTIYSGIPNASYWMLCEKGAKYYCPFGSLLNDALQSSSALRPIREKRRKAKPNTMAMMIYTSGTTGLPKAATMLHSTILSRANLFAAISSTKSCDRLYTALPLYHSAGGNLALGVCFVTGASLVLSRRFSASRAWNQIRDTRSTMVQYIGELCRYLMHVAPQNNDNKHSVRLLMGNGLRPDIWNEFQSRFGIPCIIEFYGSTEGPAGLVNICKAPYLHWHQGHLGATGVIIEHFGGLKLVKYDVDYDELKRDAAGRLIPCEFDEVGELIVKVRNRPGQQFAGYYKNEEATEKKIIRNAFYSGDKYVRTGDLFRRDVQRRWYFVDRIGDTFRWKGENVSTSEVAEVISKFPGIDEVNVYGVKVPGHDGRACMAAVCFDETSFMWERFPEYLQRLLPSYALPMFLRKVALMGVTSTLKHEKVQLRKEGIDPSVIKDPIWYFSSQGKRFNKLTLQAYQEISHKKM